ncbi:28688_t:CDS:2 [Gigaspora margarita]|uniref:28688_t:CDS:1 n=1 Tax=Gigaspora margarita TaxID=4874 RepID=A0ABN7U797_GIGMA|nr:28688_t:CDS:2 [Gigaspora margarita]
MKRLFYFLVTIALVLMIAIENGGWVKGQGTATTTQPSATLTTTTHTGGPTNGPTNGPSPTSGASNVYGSLGAMIGIAVFLMGWI